jgi:hypothetical protein
MLSGGPSPIYLLRLMLALEDVGAVFDTTSRS